MPPPSPHSCPVPLTPDPNTLLGVTVFDIPETITKYLTYTLILHIVALAFAAAATILGLLSHISTLSLLCFPTCTASLASTFALLALILDLVMFYIAKARIDAVSGASANIGICVWLTLAAWLCAGLSGCAYGIGRCCFSAREQDRAVNSERGTYGRGKGADDVRMLAIRDEQLRQKEQGLPSFQELERAPLTGDNEDKYLYEDDPQRMPGGMPHSGGAAAAGMLGAGAAQGGLRRDGSLVQGVGMGYGRRNDARTPVNGGAGGTYQSYGNGGYEGYGEYPPLPGLGGRRPSDSEASTAGAAGLGAGGGGIERPEAAAATYAYGSGNGGQHQYYDNYDMRDREYGQQHGYDQQGYADPYERNYDSYSSNPHQYAERSYHSEPSSSTPAPPQPAHTPGPGYYGYDQSQGQGAGQVHAQGQDYRDQRVSTGDPYGGYDDGLDAIGMAAQHDGGRHERDYTGATYGYRDGGRQGQNQSQNQHQGQAQGYDVHAQGYSNQQVYGSSTLAPIHAPAPQHLANPHSEILRSPMSPAAEEYQQRQDVVGGGGRGYGYAGGQEEDESMRPPSYDNVAGGGGGGYQRPEKSGYHR